MRDLRPVALTLGALSLAALAVLFAVPAAAQTPDGLPPALETVCDMESGAAFGWCNAYCEAMDCELANDNDPMTEPKASATACDKVRTKFQQQTGRDMPCEVTCPCTDNPEAFPYWAQYLAGAITVAFCFEDGQYCEQVLAAPAEYCSPPVADLTLIEAIEPSAEIVASSLGLPILGLDFAFCGDTASGIVPLSPEQGVLCKEQLDAARAAVGLVCVGFP